MANLTLTAYNSKYSNRRFVEKRDMENGFKQTGFRINGFVCQQEAWGEQQLKARNELMKKRFLELWPSIESDFEWSNDAYEEHALDVRSHPRVKVALNPAYEEIAARLPAPPSSPRASAGPATRRSTRTRCGARPPT